MNLCHRFFLILLFSQIFEIRNINDTEVLVLHKVFILSCTPIITKFSHTEDTQLQYFLHCNPVQGQYRARTGFSLCSISTQGKTCFHYRVPRWWKQVFPCEKNYTGKTLFSLQGWVCSVWSYCPNIFTRSGVFQIQSFYQGHMFNWKKKRLPSLNIILRLGLCTWEPII